MQKFKSPPRLIEGRGGVFEVRRGPQLVFSKKALGRFPTNEEVLELLEK